MVELISGKVAELVKSFEHTNEILDGFRYKREAFPLNSMPFARCPAEDSRTYIIVGLRTAGPT